MLQKYLDIKTCRHIKNVLRIEFQDITGVHGIYGCGGFYVELFSVGCILLTCKGITKKKVSMDIYCSV